jgi:hypothetical protein
MSENRQSTPDKPTKKPYNRPQLQVYGDLREITQTVGKTGQTDGGSSPVNHTNTSS